MNTVLYEPCPFFFVRMQRSWSSASVDQNHYLPHGFVVETEIGDFIYERGRHAR